MWNCCLRYTATILTSTSYMQDSRPKNYALSKEWSSESIPPSPHLPQFSNNSCESKIRHLANVLLVFYLPPQTKPWGHWRHCQSSYQSWPSDICLVFGDTRSYSAQRSTALDCLLHQYTWKICPRIFVLRVCRILTRRAEIPPARSLYQGWLQRGR